MVAEYVRRRFTVDEYHKMGDAGIVGEDDRVELIGGEIVQMTPINVHHAVCVDRLNMLFAPLLAGRGVVRVQSPIYINELNEPQPDVTLLKSSYYLNLQQQQHPGPEDILLLIEVADSTLTTDRRRKVPLYATAGIHEVWIVNIQKKVVEFFVDPAGGKYNRVGRVGLGHTLNPQSLPDITLKVDDIFS
ncbi:MAG: Uma2 family endonuclease [Chloroflexota bacterium]|nr:Uma2 family endonuclease [Chloroflexota bacterium]